ncbi:hypothetical protein ACFWP3_17065 [Streptomyces sp. NPDC058525]|uniref:hypothetical protein n=1 Tax=Streptomyces sp. NPDC058525 TaxID=3346538 RepID=UPI00365EEAA2
MTNNKPPAWIEAVQNHEQGLAELSALIEHAPMSADGWDKEKAQADLRAFQAECAKSKNAATAGNDGAVIARGAITYPAMPDFGKLYAEAGFCFPASDFDNQWDKEAAEAKVKELRKYAAQIEEASQDRHGTHDGPVR